MKFESSLTTLFRNLRPVEKKKGGILIKKILRIYYMQKQKLCYDRNDVQIILLIQYYI